MKRQESFNVVAKRDLNLVPADDVPGPGAYDQTLANAKRAAAVSKLTEKRWKEEHQLQLQQQQMLVGGQVSQTAAIMAARSRMPGPADYELSPMYQDTVLKGTFNATLNNPLALKRMQQQAIAEEAAYLNSGGGGGSSANFGVNNTLDKAAQFQTLKV